MVMKVFNSKDATEEYMSMHSLTYSTPDMILRKFAAWLGELVDMECKLSAEECPNEDGLHPRHRVPRLMLYIEDRDIPYTLQTEEEFKPTGAITSYFSNIKSAEKRYCHECGNELSSEFKFCANCGTRID